MVFSPTGSATETSPIDPQPQADGNIGDTQLISVAALLTVLKCHFQPSTILNNQGKLHALLAYLYH
jgi:hypothetical protein